MTPYFIRCYIKLRGNGAHAEEFSNFQKPKILSREPPRKCHLSICQFVKYIKTPKAIISHHRPSSIIHRPSLHRCGGSNQCMCFSSRCPCVTNRPSVCTYSYDLSIVRVRPYMTSCKKIHFFFLCTLI